MKKLNLFRSSMLVAIAIATSCVVHLFMVTTLSCQQASFQAPFDFDQFLSELESALAKIDEEEKGKKQGAGQVAPISSQPEQSSQTTPLFGWNVPSLQKSHEKKDPAALFLDPAIQTITSKTGQKTTSATKDSLNACKTIMDEFTHHLSSLKNKIGNLPQLSPGFKEEFSLFYRHLVDTIIIAHQQIKSRKTYQQLFLAPPEANKQFAGDMKKLRNMILNTARKIKRLDTQLVIKRQHEEAESAAALLGKLATQYQETDLSESQKQEIEQSSQAEEKRNKHADQ